MFEGRRTIGFILTLLTILTVVILTRIVVILLILEFKQFQWTFDNSILSKSHEQLLSRHSQQIS